MKEEKEQKVNLEPRISLNKLGEFLTTNPARRRKILVDQKYPKDFVVTRYNDAEKAIINYLFDNKHDTSILDSALDTIDKKYVKTDWEAQTRSLNYDAIDSFYDIADQIDYSKCSLEKGIKGESNYIMVEDVGVSIRPELFIYKVKGEDKNIGAIKLYFSKTFELSDEAGEYIASFIMEYLRTTKSALTASNKLCNVIDVFGQKVFMAPISYKRRMLDIKAACQEISAIWNKL
jgi:hypothetical protein